MNGRIRRRMLPLSLAASLLPAALVAQGEPLSAAPLASIAATLERIESLLRLDQGAQLVTLRMRRLELLRAEMAPLESELRQMKSSDFWEGPEIATQEKGLETLDEQIERARLDGDPQQAEMLQMSRHQMEAQIEAMKLRAKIKERRVEELESSLGYLRSERDAAVAEIDGMLARYEQDLRRER